MESTVDYRAAYLAVKDFAHMLMQELEHIEGYEKHPVMLMDYYRKRAKELGICDTSACSAE